MSYKSDNRKNVVWRKWILEDQQALNSCGLPLLVIKNEEHWWDFLEHGYLDHHDDPSGFTVDDLSPEEKRCLYAFLQTALIEMEEPSVRVLRMLDQQLKG